MSYLDMITLDGPTGTVAVRPDAVVAIWKAGDTSELQLTSGVRVPINIDAKSAAVALWGFSSETDNACFNDAQVLAILPHGAGSRITLAGNINLDNAMPINNMIMSLRNLEAQRAELRRQRDMDES